MKLQRYNGNFAGCLEQLGKQRFATAKEGMLYRMQEGINSDACRNGAWFSEDFNVVDGRILVARAKYNPLIRYAQKAVDLHGNNKEFLLTKDILIDGKPAKDVLLEAAEKDSKKAVSKKRVLDLGSLKTHNVPTDCFSDDKSIVYLAQGEKLANEYGLFLRDEADIKEVIFCLPEVRKEDYSREFWLHRTDFGGGSDFFGLRVLGDDYGSLFGVSDSAVGTQKIANPTLDQILKVSKSFVSDASRADFESKIRELYQK